MANTSSTCFEGWKLAYKLEPWGDDWLQAAMQCTAAVNPHVKKAMKIEDFMPNRKRSPGMTDPEEMEQAMAAMCGVGVA